MFTFSKHVFLRGPTTPSVQFGSALPYTSILHVIGDNTRLLLTMKGDTVKVVADIDGCIIGLN